MAISNKDLEAGYLGKQSAKYTPAINFKHAPLYSSVDWKTPKGQIKVGADLGSGFWDYQMYNNSLAVQVTYGGVPSLSSNVAHLFDGWCSRDDTGATTGPAYTYAYSPNYRNPQFNWYSHNLVYGVGGTAHTGIRRVVARDGKQTGWSFTLSNKAAPAFQTNWMCLNEGPGNVGDTFVVDPEFNMPIPNNAGFTTYTWPSWFPSDLTNLCPLTLGMSWKPQVENAGPCLDKAEYTDFIIGDADIELDFTFYFDATTTKIQEYFDYLTNSPAAGSSGLKAGFPTGGMSVTLSNGVSIPTTTTPYSLAFNYPDLQWVDVQTNTNETVPTLTVKAMTYYHNMNFTAVTDKTPTQMSF